MEFKHTSVLFEACMEGLAIKSDGIYVDGTLRGGARRAFTRDRHDTKVSLRGTHTRQKDKKQ